MKKGQGKNKGSGFEREIGAKLSLWFSHGERKDLCCRTVGSGAQFTFTKGSGNPGDLMGQHPTAIKFFDRFVVECKFWKDIQFLRFLEGEGDLYEAMQKVKKEAASQSKMWWLVVRQNHRKTIVLMPIGAAVGISKAYGYNVPFHQIHSGGVMMFYFDEFLKLTSPE